MLLALRDDGDRIGDDAALIGLRRLDLEALLDVLQGEHVFVGIDVVHVEPIRLRAIRDEQLLHALLHRVGSAHEHPDLDAFGEGVERLHRRGGERVALVLRDVPPRVFAAREDVDQHRDDDGGDDPEERRGMGGIDEALLHPHLHASTARTETKSGSAVMVP